MPTISSTAISRLVRVARDASKLKIDQQLMAISLSRISDVGKCVLAAEIKSGVSAYFLIFLTIQVPNSRYCERVNFAMFSLSLAS